MSKGGESDAKGPSLEPQVPVPAGHISKQPSRNTSGEGRPFVAGRPSLRLKPTSIPVRCRPPISFDNTKKLYLAPLAR